MDKISWLQEGGVRLDPTLDLLQWEVSEVLGWEGGRPLPQVMLCFAQWRGDSEGPYLDPGQGKTQISCQTPSSSGAPWLPRPFLGLLPKEGLLL